MSFKEEKKVKKKRTCVERNKHETETFADCESKDVESQIPQEVLEALDRCVGRLTMTDEQEKFIRIYKYFARNELMHRRHENSVFDIEHQYPLIECLDDLERVLGDHKRVCPLGLENCPKHALGGVYTDGIEYTAQEAMKQLKDLDDRIENERRKYRSDSRTFQSYMLQRKK